MNGLWFLALLILVAGLPVIPAWFAFRLRKLDGRLFLLSLAAGLLSVPAAVFLQSFFPPAGTGRGAVMFGVFIRIALAEELSRLLTLFPLRGFAGRPLPWGEIPLSGGGSPRDIGAMTGFAAGLGFAAAESGFYSSSDISIALLRVFTAAPLHGACGARLGSAAACFPLRPIRALGLILGAVLLHGLYDFFILSPGIPSVLSILIALSALGSTLVSLHPEPR